MNYSCEFLCARARDAVCQRFICSMEQRVHRRLFQHGTIVGHAWEQHCITLLSQGFRGRPVQWQWRKLYARKKKTGTVVFRIAGTVKAASNTHQSYVDARVSDNKSCLVLPQVRNQPLEDAGICCERVGFQMFVMEDGFHRCSVDWALKLEKATRSFGKGPYILYLMVPVCLSSAVTGMNFRAGNKRASEKSVKNVKRKIEFRVLTVTGDQFDTSRRFIEPEV